MPLLALGLNHQTAPLSLRERVALDPEAARALAARLGPDAVVLSTCNRVEVYADTDGFHAGVDAVTDLLAQRSGVPLDDLKRHLYVHWEGQAVQHLFQVAAGLDSMVVGESQILGQLRKAYTAARDGDAAGRTLHELFQKALNVGKRVHSETGIDEAGQSLVSVALERAVEAVGPVEGRTVLVVGAGSMGALAGATVRRAGVGRIVVANRSLENAQRLATALEGEGVGLDAVEGALAEADVVITSTGATGIVVPILAKSGDAVTVGTPCGRQATLRNGRPLAGTVVLDAGHGGVEPGGVGPGGLTEKALNLAVTQHAQQALEAAGHPVVLTRAGDYRISLDARAKIVEAVKPRAFVSIHYNAEPDGPRGGPGAETYYQTVGASVAESKRLAGLIYEEIVAAMSQYQVAWVADADAGAKYRKNAQGNDYYGILRRTQGTAATLAELGFVSNPPEEELYKTPDVQKVAGAAVAKGIIRFLTTPDPGSGFVEPYPRETPAGGGGGSDNCVDPPLE